MSCTVLELHVMDPCLSIFIMINESKEFSLNSIKMQHLIALNIILNILHHILSLSLQSGHKYWHKYYAHGWKPEVRMNALYVDIKNM